MSRDLVFEIGCEEIPSAPLDDAVGQVRDAAAAALDSARLEYSDLSVHGAPRRLVLRVSGLADRREERHMRVRGPAAKAAFDAEGAPTKAAEGFAASRGVSVADLVRDTENGGEYVFADIDETGAPAAEVLPSLLSELASGIEWVKSQRWGDGEDRFIRPVRWLLALHGADVIPVEFAGLTAGRLTYGHRFLVSNPIQVASAEEYAQAAERGMFVFDHDARAAAVKEGVEGAAAAVGAVAVMPRKTFAEVVNLVEWPTVALGRFDTDFLSVPREVLETAMESHQRYFPTQGADGALLETFVVVHNGDPAWSDSIVAGHERVIRARLADASFFYSEDLKVGDEERVSRLGSIVFHDRLGTVAAKVERLERLVEALAAQAGAPADTSAAAVRAAHLCKSDLVSHVVVEFPTLQGVMGRYYAMAGGEDQAVADAVLEHYQPRTARDALPASVAGSLVAAADRLDTMCGMFAIDAAPTGSADPYALRRGAIGVLSMILDGGLALRADEAVAAAVSGYEGQVEGLQDGGTAASVRAFLTGRLEGMLKERGHAYDTVDAVLAVAADDPADARDRCDALTAFRAGETAEDLLIACKRAANLADVSCGNEPDPSVMGESETALLEAIRAAEASINTRVAERRYADALALLAELRGPIDTFFDDVLVMDEDAKLRTNRLALLNRFVGLFEQFADFGRLAG